MLVPVFHGLSPLDFVSPTRTQSWFPFNAADTKYFYRARNAIYHLFVELKKARRQLKVLVPDYNSGNEVLAIRAAGASVEYCPVGIDMAIRPDEVERLCEVHHPDVLYVIHYAGWPQPVSALAELCRRRRMVLIEDCALALLSEAEGRPLGSFGDWSVFCLYKTLPVPNGAVLVRNASADVDMPEVALHSAGVSTTAGRIAELFVQRARMRAGRLGDVLSVAKRTAGRAASALSIERPNVGDIGFELNHVDLGMSRISHWLLSRLDLERIKQRRVDNYQMLTAAVGDRVTSPMADLPAGANPLFLPILVEKKREIVDALQGHGIDALEFWNDSCESGGWEMSPPARFLREHVVEIPLHQDLTPDHMRYVAEQLTLLNLRFIDGRRRILAA